MNKAIRTVKMEFHITDANNIKLNIIKPLPFFVILYHDKPYFRNMGHFLNIYKKKIKIIIKML